MTKARNLGSFTFDREQWLTSAITMLGKLLPKDKWVVPEGLWVSVGWPQGAKSDAIGECWEMNGSADKLQHIFISPKIQTGVQVMATLMHEIGHAIIQRKFPKATAHGKEFRDFMRDAGLEGRPTRTHAGPRLLIELVTIELEIGKYSHGQLSEGLRRPKEPTRLLKLECPSCGMILRATRTSIDTIGFPICVCRPIPNGSQFMYSLPRKRPPHS